MENYEYLDLNEDTMLTLSSIGVEKFEDGELFGLKYDGEVIVPAKYTYISDEINQNGMIIVRDVDDNRGALDIYSYLPEESDDDHQHSGLTPEEKGMDPDDYDEDYTDGEIDVIIADEIRDGKRMGYVDDYNYTDEESDTITWKLDFADGATPEESDYDEIADAVENGAATGVTSMSDIVWNLNFLGADEINESLKILTLCEGWVGMKSYPTPRDFESIVNQYIDDAVGEYEDDTPSVDYESDEEEIARQEELQYRYREKLEQIKREIWNEIKYDVKAAEDIAYKIDRMLVDKLGVRETSPDWIPKDLKESNNGSEIGAAALIKMYSDSGLTREEMIKDKESISKSYDFDDYVDNFGGLLDSVGYQRVKSWISALKESKISTADRERIMRDLRTFFGDLDSYPSDSISVLYDYLSKNLPHNYELASDSLDDIAKYGLYKIDHEIEELWDRSEVSKKYNYAEFKHSNQYVEVRDHVDSDISIWYAESELPIIDDSNYDESIENLESTLDAGYLNNPDETFAEVDPLFHDWANRQKKIYGESKLSTADKKKLHPETFGAKYNGEEKYPLNDEEHVRSAISYFHKCPKDKQKSLAQKIVKAAKKFGVEISEKSKVMKALNESMEVDDITFGVKVQDSMGNVFTITGFEPGDINKLTDADGKTIKVSDYDLIKNYSKYKKISNSGKFDYLMTMPPEKRIREARMIMFDDSTPEEQEELGRIIDDAKKELSPDWLARKQKVMGDHLTRQGY
jgi:hypothetical protein